MCSVRAVGMRASSGLVRKWWMQVVVDLDDDGTEAALITGELKRLRPEVPVIILVTDEKALANGATQQASAVVVKSREARSLIEALKELFPAQ